MANETQALLSITLHRLKSCTTIRVLILPSNRTGLQNRLKPISIEREKTLVQSFNLLKCSFLSTSKQTQKNIRILQVSTHSKIQRKLYILSIMKRKQNSLLHTKFSEKKSKVRKTDKSEKCKMRTIATILIHGDIAHLLEPLIRILPDLTED